MRTLISRLKLVRHILRGRPAVFRLWFPYGAELPPNTMHLMIVECEFKPPKEPTKLFVLY